MPSSPWPGAFLVPRDRLGPDAARELQHARDVRRAVLSTDPFRERRGVFAFPQASILISALLPLRMEALQGKSQAADREIDDFMTLPRSRAA
jgi:hypothetical protein